MSGKLQIKELYGVIDIIIKEDCKFEEFLQEAKTKLDSKDLHRLVLSFIEPNLVIKQGKMFVFAKDNLVFNLYKNDDRLYISQKKLIENEVEESIIDLYYGDKFSITNMIHDQKGSTKNIRVYNSDKTIEHFFLDRKEALAIAHKILETVGEFLIIGDIYTMFNLIPDEQYHPVINDDVIMLSLCEPYWDRCLSLNIAQTLNIILNDTKENVGVIYFDYSIDVNSEFSPGNVCYEVFEEYRNKGYASRALKLLKKYLCNLEYSGDKDLYFWISYNNISSQKVVLKNGGEVVREDSKGTNEIDNGYTYKIKI